MPVASAALRERAAENRPRILPRWMTMLRTALLVLAMFAQLPGPSCAAAQSVSAPPSPLSFQHAHAMVMRARANDVTDLRVLVATDIGAAPRVLSRIEAMGGRLEARFDEVGYLRVRLHRDRVLALTRVAEVVAVQPVPGGSAAGYHNDLDLADISERGMAGFRVLESARREDAWEVTRAALPLLDASAFRRASPYVPWRAMGTDALLAANPTFDGRGVTIAVFEPDAPDFTHATLQHALTIAGDTVPKIAAIVDPEWGETPLGRSHTAMPTVAPAIPRRHVAADTLVEGGAGGGFHWRGRYYHAPASGTYWFGHYRAPTGSYPVLWRSVDGAVWVDTSARGDFRGVAPVFDYNVRRSLGWLPGTRRGASPVAFAVSVDSAGDRVRIIPGSDAHLTMVAGTAAGHTFLGGELGGVAPAARLIVVTGFCSELHVTLEGFMRAARHPAVDIISASFGATSTFPDNAGFAPLMMSRIVEAYGKPVFMSIGNGGQLLGLGGDASKAPGVIAVGAYSTRASMALHNGWRPGAPGDDWLRPYSSWGPSRAGSPKPDLVAPAGAVAPTPCGAAPSRREQRYRLPDCYVLGGGTSQATPAAAGAAALLMSGAKQSRVPHDGTRLAWALRAGARHLSTWPARGQGAGLVQLPASWELLRGTAHRPSIHVAASVRQAQSRHFREPGVGEGLYERDGWHAGERRVRMLRLTRRTGAPEDARFDLRWVGNDGTFATPGSVMLPLGREVAVPVTVQPHTPGAHDAILEVVDPSTSATIRTIGATVIAADQFTEGNGHSVHHAGVVSFGVDRSHFVHVPRGTAALRVSLRVTAGALRFRAVGPAAENTWGALAIRMPYAAIQDHLWYGPADGTRTMLIEHPEPGTWELALTSYPERPETTTIDTDGRYELAVELLDAEISARAIRSTTSGAPSALAITAHNIAARLPGARTVVELGTARSVRGAVSTTSDTIPAQTFQVDSGTATLLVRARTSMPDGEVFLYLYDCTSDRCRLWNLADESGASRGLVVRNPRPGRWKMMLDPTVTPRGGLVYEITAIMTHSRYGGAERPGGAVSRRSGAVWSGTLRLRVSPTANADERLVALVELRDDVIERLERDSTLGKILVPLQTRPIALGRTVLELGASTPATGMAGRALWRER